MQAASENMQTQIKEAFCFGGLNLPSLKYAFHCQAWGDFLE